jgi:hypothetical protein
MADTSHQLTGVSLPLSVALLGAPSIEQEAVVMQDQYFTYHGSLTTPPCSEDAKYFVVKKALKTSRGQVKLLKDVIPDKVNGRPPQNGRWPPGTLQVNTGGYTNDEAAQSIKIAQLKAGIEVSKPPIVPEIEEAKLEAAKFEKMAAGSPAATSAAVQAATEAATVAVQKAFASAQEKAEEALMRSGAFVAGKQTANMKAQAKANPDPVAAAAQANMPAEAPPAEAPKSLRR